MFLLISFLLSCCLGATAAWRVKPDNAPALAATTLILCSAIVTGALTVAAESGSATARNLGLLAVLLAGAAFVSASVAAARAAGAPSANRQP